MVGTLAVLALMGAAASGVEDETPRSQIINLPVQSRVRAVGALSRQFGIVIVAAGTDLTGDLVEPIHGAMDLNEALSSVLRGTDRVFNLNTDGFIVISPKPVAPPPARAVELLLIVVSFHTLTIR